MSPRTVVRALTVVALSGLWLPMGFTQGRGGGGGSTPAGGGSSTTGSPTTTAPSPGRTPTIPNTPTQPTNPQQGVPPQPIFLSGRVLLEDGTPPPETVTMESVCGSSQHNEGYTDSKGYFSIEFGRRMGVLQDASESSGGFGGGGLGGPAESSTGGFGGGGFGGGRLSSGASDMRLFNCELRAKLAGYRSQSYSLVNRRPMDNPDIGVILLHRIAEGEGSTISASTLAAPKDARKAFEKGQEAMKKRKVDDALKNLQKAVDLYPDFAAAWFELGRIQASKGDLETARKSYEAAAKSDSKFVPPLVEIANLSLKQQNWKEVAEITDRAGKLNSFDYPQVFLMNAVANYNLHNLDAAEKSVRQAEKLDTRHQYPKSSHLLGIILAQRQDYAGAAEQFRAYLRLAPGASDAATVRSQLDQVEKAAPAKQDQQDK